MMQDVHVKVTPGLPRHKRHSTRRIISSPYSALKFKEETSKVLHLGNSLGRWWLLDPSENRSEIPGKFWNVVLEKDGEGQLDRTCEQRRSITQSWGGREYPAYNLRRNCLLTRVVKGNI